jgi:type III secretion protein C
MAVVLSPGALAQWSDRPFSYVAVGQDLRQLLRDFAASQGLGIVISDQVQGTISGNFQEVQPRAFIDEIASTYGLVWYLFGGVLYIYDAGETQSEIIYLANTRPDFLRPPLEQLGILDPRFDWRADADLGIVVVTGPPRYTEIVKQVIQAIEARRSDAPGVEVIRLKHASAIDRTISYRDQEITVPGVATILRRMIGQNQFTSMQRTLPATIPALVGLRGQGLIAQGRTPEVMPGAPTGPAAPGEPAAPAPAGEAAQVLSDPLGALDVVSIEADPRLNAVIISARGDRLPFFERLVEQLDTPSELIQIDVTIIDVAADRLTQLGVDWQAMFGDFTAGVTSLIVPRIDAGLGITVMGGDFEAEVRALERVGDARIVSQPSVLTFDSVEAVVDETESIYIRVAGQEDVDLFQVQTGTLLRVTPRIVSVRDVPDVELFVDIRDGSFENEDTLQVDDIPRVNESQLTTSAIVSEGEGLLLGGLYRTRSEDTNEKVPILGDIPLLGLAFRSQTTQQSSVVRLFLLTPRVVAIGVTTGERIELVPPTSDPGARTPAQPSGPRDLRSGAPRRLVPAAVPAGRSAVLPAQATSCDAPSDAVPAALTYRTAAGRLGCRPPPAATPAPAAPSSLRGLY